MQVNLTKVSYHFLRTLLKAMYLERDACGDCGVASGDVEAVRAEMRGRMGFDTVDDPYGA